MDNLKLYKFYTSSLAWLTIALFFSFPLLHFEKLAIVFFAVFLMYILLQPVLIIPAIIFHRILKGQTGGRGALIIFSAVVYGLVLYMVISTCLEPPWHFG